MKLLYITNQIGGPGGLERVLSIKASYFADQLNYDVHIVSLNENNRDSFFVFSDMIKFHNIEVRSSKLLYTWDYLKGVRNAIKQIKPEIVLVCDDGIKGMLLARLIGKKCPFIFERHVSKKVALNSQRNTITSQIRARIINFLMQWGGKSYDAFVVLTKGNLNEWNLSNLEVIPNPLPFKPKETSTLCNKTVIAVGKHSYQKGYDRLVEAWQIVHKKNPSWKLEIYGSPNKDNDLTPLITELNLHDCISLYNPVSNIQEKLLNSSIHVLSSRYEGFGMVIIEAMACGLPSVSFNCHYGPSDIIENNFNGILVEEGNISNLSDALSQLIENIDIRLKLGRNARDSVNKYNIEIISEKWVKLFQKVTN